MAMVILMLPSNHNSGSIHVAIYTELKAANKHRIKFAYFH